METLLTSPKRGGKMPESRWPMAWTNSVGQGFKVRRLVRLVDLRTQKDQSETALVLSIDSASTTGHESDNRFVFRCSIFPS